MDIQDIIEALENSKGSSDLDKAVLAILDPDADGLAPCTTNLVEALNLCRRALPGWWWSLGQCCVSDDACVAPDFNCPENGTRLRAQFNEDVDWAGLTDVDLRPPGREAVALCISMLKARQLIDDGAYAAPQEAAA